MPYIKSLNQRLLFFVLIPLAILLVVMGMVGFIYARDALRKQWTETVILRLRQTAHNVDMGLERPKQLLELYNDSIGTPGEADIRRVVLARLKELEGVAAVRQEGSVDSEPEPATMPITGRGMGRGAGMGRRAGQTSGMGRYGMMRVNPPRYSEEIKGRVVTLESQTDAPERIEVDIRFDYLIKDLAALGRWQDSTVVLVDQNGDVLNPKDLGDWPASEDGRDLKKSTLEAMAREPSGTVFGQGKPPRLMCGYYRLVQAPWTLVIFAPGREVLSGILTFRMYFLGAAAGFTLLILFLVRLVTGRSIDAIKTVSGAARQLARGRFGPPIPVRSDDEVGELTRSFNAMVGQLKDRLRIKKSLDLAMEVQLSLLPQSPPTIPGIDAAGRSIYCDETGGDYFDYISRGPGGARKWVLIVGDVSDHGLPSALLMTTARAFLRQRVQRPGGPADILTDVNRLLAEDTSESGLFMTVFCLEIDPDEKTAAWSTAGHDPAMVYDGQSGSFEDLDANGPALGIVDNHQYQGYSRTLGPGRVVLIGTDGIWETRNPDGEQFGKDRLRSVIAKHHHHSAEKILEAVVDAVNRFRGDAAITDDLTLIVMKTST